MRKFLLIATLIFSLGMTSVAQSSFNQTASNPTGAITNASVDTMNARLSQSFNVVTVQATVTRLSGTAAGAATLYYSVDGVSYVTTGTPLTLTNVASQTVVWNTTSAARYWRVIVGGATTVTATASAKISASK